MAGGKGVGAGPKLPAARETNRSPAGFAATEPVMTPAIVVAGYEGINREIGFVDRS